ncbi:MAG: sigma-54-dependent Fis family transcriptional regulator [Deltaproteobacteria bacterium]|nr:MAG: sigma-54-dependent Fis family transcriptional regulator [Deltaproteobacteria bacterium]
MHEWDPSYFQILVIDDEKNICRTIKMVLEGEGYRVLTATNGDVGLDLVQSEVIDLVLLDLFLPGGPDGHSVLREIKRIDPDVEVIMISGHGKIEDAVQAVKQGAYSFIEKPLERELLLMSVEQSLEKRWLVRQMRSLEHERSEQYQMVGNTPSMQAIFRQIERVAPTDGWVLITGESGTGKELVARGIHEHSKRAGRPFVKVNCAAIPEELIESELFGHERGAFTGAVRTRQGEFERAHTGTIFLDEIGDMSPHAQAKVLRVLNSGEFSRVGGDRTLHVDVRVIAATNRDLEEDIRNERFREDLYFRLNVIPIEIPPLRERRDDIPLLLETFLNHYAQNYGYQLQTITPNAMKHLLQYAFPGNVRELKNLAERLAILGGPTIDVEDLPSHLQEKRAVIDIKSMGNRTLREVREEVERSYILLKLKENEWNISRTSDVLGIERTNLHKKMKSYNIQRPGSA